MAEVKAEGKNFLKVCGILMIIFGGISLIMQPISCSCNVAVGAVLEEYGMSGAIFYVSAVIGVIAAAIQIVTGIIGCANCNKPEKAGVCVVFGLITLILAIIPFILTIVSNGQIASLVAEQGIDLSSSGSSVVISLITSLAVPVLFLIGAFLNKKKANA